MTVTTTDRPTPSPARSRVARVVSTPVRRHLLGALLALVVVILVLESVSTFRQSQLTSVAYLAIAAAGLTVLTGFNGQLSLGHGAFMAVGAYTAALMLRANESGWSVPLVLIAATVVAGLVGVVVGVAAARLHGPYLAGATLALAVAVPGLALYFSEYLGGEQGLIVPSPDVPSALDDIAFFVTGNELTSTKFVAYVGWFLLVLVFFLLANVSSSRVGRRWRAVRDDEVSAEIAGIDLGRARVLAFVVSAACAGAAGAIMAMASRIAAPSGFTLVLSLTLLSAVVIGGLGSLTGALIGAALLTYIPPVVTNLGLDAGLSSLQAAELAPLVTGIFTVVVILFAPLGLVGTVRGRLVQRRLKREGVR
ncbi:MULTISPECIES: branched-chain amino acid ABC transporter permease [unclassified Rhodococcus (in: high G+C Gram-positive bacteria)]|uniref:branched-chain amino acid ABC transporter permease n=1 Tax=unclassified Rhodococcus (in: high G+C Gram-positive bacteria) TaxID=192944 RepID=UPI0006F25827|nr:MULTISPECIES: branched-chain amino acid ABC transporter permease [unclassified Rhodococcus (in: high G+C Gram-positive bacteria)]KQU36491.1 branched-chain amino acid ABC transporter permease [Rhodococcus sp. Leaf225]KQU49040.1 branched-chain amino acid ABC transporter permease [Rhodococcus sp. Leaf258]